MLRRRWVSSPWEQVCMPDVGCPEDAREHYCPGFGSASCRPTNQPLVGRVDDAGSLLPGASWEDSVISVTLVSCRSP